MKRPVQGRRHPDILDRADPRMLSTWELNFVAALVLLAMALLFVQWLVGHNHVIEMQHADRGHGTVEAPSTSVFMLVAGVPNLVAVCAMLAALYLQRHYYRRLAAEKIQRQQEIQRASESKASFLTMMSHELRTPVNAMTGCLALIDRGDLTVEQSELVAEARAAGEQLGGVLGDLMDFADLEDGRFPVTRGAVRLSELAARLDDELARSTRGRASIESAHAAPDVFVELDQIGLVRAVAALAGDVASVSTRARIVVTIGYTGEEVVIEGRAIGRETIGRETVADHLAGRNRSLVNRDAFGAPRESLRRALARGIVEEMGGRCSLDLGETSPELRAGAVFRLSIPADRLDRGEPRARVIASTGTLETLLSAHLAALGWRLWQSGEPANSVSLLVVEGDLGCEDEMMRFMAEAHGEPRIVRIGRAPRALGAQLGAQERTSSAEDAEDVLMTIPLTARALAAAIGTPDECRVRVGPSRDWEEADQATPRMQGWR